MEDKNFDWQGKKKENVEFSYKMIFWSTLMCVVTLIGISLIRILQVLF